MQRLSKYIFWSLIIVAQVLALATYILMHTWLNKYTGGFNWSSSTSKHVQNYHALFMTLGFLLLFGEATLMYRILARFNTSYLYQKVVHVSVLLTAFVFWSVGLAAAFKARHLDRKEGKLFSEFYSFHSWMGFILMFIFVSQLLIALGWYINIRFISPTFQTQYKAVHVYNGVFLFTLSTATCFTGLNEVGIYKISNYGELPGAGIHLNFAGVCMLGFAAVIGYILYKPEFKLTPEVEGDADVQDDTEVEGDMAEKETVKSRQENGLVEEEIATV